MYGPTIKATYDRGAGPVELELGVVKDVSEAAKLFTGWINDNRIRLYLSAPRPLTVEAETDWIRAQYDSRDTITWSIYASGGLIGNIGIFDIDTQHGRAELGILIGDRSWWGRGVATAVEALVVDYCFQNIVRGGLNKIIARVIAGNEASQRALEKVGFSEVGVFRKDHWACGRWFDIWMSELLAEDWRATREQCFGAAGITSFSLYPGCEDELSITDED